MLVSDLVLVEEEKSVLWKNEEGFLPIRCQDDSARYPRGGRGQEAGGHCHSKSRKLNNGKQDGEEARTNPHEADHSS